MMSSWYQSLLPLKVDVVGDFAGKELFAIHGDSLLLHCITRAKVDYDNGFQLLHAVHAVETFLDNLRRRGCRFHIVWFDDNEQLCVPTSAMEPEPYLLTRAVLIKHLGRHDAVSGSGQLNFQFSDVDSAEFDKYLKDNAVFFFLYLDGHACFGSEEGDRAARYLDPVYKLGLRGYNVAFLDTLEFASSKVHVSVVSPSTTPWDGHDVQEKGGMTRAPFKEISNLEQGKTGSNGGPSPWGKEEPLTVRDVVSLTALSNLLLDNPSDATRRAVAAYIVHLAIIRASELSQRSLDVTPLEEKHQAVLNDFLLSFCRVCQSILEDDQSLSSLAWDAPDLVDGRILRHVFLELESLRIPHSLAARIEHYANRLSALTKVGLSDYLPTAHAVGDSSVALDGVPSDGNPTSVMPFTNPVLKSYLEDVHVDIADPQEFPGLGTTDRVFQDITQWQNANKQADPKKQYQKPPGFFARRRNQRFMADTIAYSASLTNSSGKLITPQTIVVQQPEDPKAKKSWAPKSKKATQGQQDGPRKLEGGRRAAVAESAKIEQAKRDTKAKGAMVAWQSRCAEFEREDDPIKRFVKVTRYIIGLAAIDLEAVGPEASLYAMNILAKFLHRQRSEKGATEASDFDTLALIWKMVMEMESAPMSPKVAKEFMVAAKSVGLPVNFAPDTSREKALPFTSILSDRLPQIQTFMDPLEFQLKFCGPYLDRGFDPKPDPRVRFTPDAWQTKVLDTIDADKSLLVIAPTSSGKTFISFYAMKKILQSSDDSVLVYVAPTKALVNQIAAEIQAEFSKSYKHQGKSVWAIHTRDHRVNSPTGCQVLVTIPHILEAMLLAPSNAKTPDSWARRVKRIIFDEVHCIGQTEDGVIWEHLLLLAPCPMIALSATVGNAMEFKDWLERAQKTKNLDFEMVVHSARYSDLRKFIYFPPKKYVFDGLKPTKRLPVPGLEPIQATADGGSGSGFAFIHPIASLTNRHRGTLDDISLEPRDCLELWQCMVKHQTERYPVGEGLDPRAFVGKVAKKAEVVQWGAALKEVLVKWIEDIESPFSAVQQDLRSLIIEPPESHAGDIIKPSTGVRMGFEAGSDDLFSNALPLLMDLHRQGSLPALLFNYDREDCEKTAFDVLHRLEAAEKHWKETSPEWTKKMRDYEAWKKNAPKRARVSKQSSKGEVGASKADLMREAASRETHPMESFDPAAPVPTCSFADQSKLLQSELEVHIKKLSYANLNPDFISCLRRGIGVHHAGMNRAYRQVVEILFRKGFLTVVIATGTLAMGINMPCKTVVFFGDSVFLTALNYQQGAGRSGRRGFDQLGNVVFVGMKPERVYEIMSSRLPDLQGHFPLSTTLILRLLSLLHNTENSEYAVKALNSMLSQTHLYLGGPSDQMAIKHHVRFSIDYLRRQNLLSQEGAPLNFAGLVGHLYFTENSVFAFHSLLREGYFYEVCRDIRQRPKDVLQELVLVMSHLFCRFPVRNYKDKDFLENVVNRSTSMILLPPLPQEAEKILRKLNDETLGIFTTYVNTYVEQHLSGSQDDALPFTGQKVGGHGDTKCNAGSILGSRPPTKLRSPFAAMSGLTDDFGSIQDLCDTVRSGVFLEESVIPYTPIYPDDTGGVPWNAYIYDFFKHGNLQTLVDDNGIKSADVWFHLKDFSLILATITTSLSNYFSQEVVADDAMMDIEDAADPAEEGVDGADEVEEEAAAKPTVQEAPKRVVPKPKKKKKAVVADSWEDESEEESESEESEEEEEKPKGRIEDNDLMLVLTAFTKLREEYDEKFRKIGS